MNARPWHRTILRMAGLALAGPVTVAMAVVYTVDDDDPLADFHSVQAAVFAASGLDTVLVRCGLYVENVVIQGDGDGVPDVIGEDPDCTILDGNAAGPVVVLVGVDSDVEFSGFTVRNGRSTIGGGIRVEIGDPVICRNRIEGNVAVREGSRFGYGGGISLLNASPVISNNLIAGNVAEFSGGGLDMYSSSPTVVNNTFVGNRAERPGTGEAYGGALYALESSPTITSNLILRNVAEAGAGGIDLQNSSYTVEYNDLYENTPAQWSCIDLTVPCPASFPFPPGNVNLDPKVTKPSQGYCPLLDSPLRDAGPVTPPTAVEDFFGRPRVQDGDFDGSAIVDMGACETDEVTGLALGPGGAVTWTAGAPIVARYNLYRGLLSLLLASCASNPPDCQFTQDPGVVIEARRDCDLTTNAFTDLDTPPLGDFFIYLVSGENLVEGVVGRTSDGTPRLNGHSCP